MSAWFRRWWSFATRQQEERAPAARAVAPTIRSPEQAAHPGVPMFLRAGEPLDGTARAAMEPAVGHDLADVRVHSGDDAARAAASLGARAFTTGRDIVFGAGEYAPQSAEGGRLLAHELAHVAQQARRGAPSAATPLLDTRGDAHERAADAVAAGSVAAAPAAHAPLVQRQVAPGAAPLEVPDVRLRPPPMVARAMGSLTIDDFALDSAALTATHRGQLAALAITLADLLHDYPGGTVSVVGHADLTGEAAHNQTLGQERADAAAGALIDAGVRPGAVATSSAGASQPVVQTTEANARNRRVEIRFEPELRLPPRPIEERLHLVPPEELQLRAPELPPPTPPVDLTYHPTIRPETMEERIERILREPPPTPARPQGRSVNELIFEQADRAMDGLADALHLPRELRPYLRRAARAAVERLETTVLDSVMDEMRLDDSSQAAIRHAVEGILQQQWPPSAPPAPGARAP